MKIGVIHDVDDPEVFHEQGMEMIEKENVPEGVDPQQFCPSTDGTSATCVWEAESVDQLSNHIDPSLGEASTQEYFAIDEENAVSLPE